MFKLLIGLVDGWRRRGWRLDPEALAALPRGAPATVVTGGSEGIGFELARCFARDGHTIVLVARSQDLLAQSAAAITAEFDVQALALVLDVTAPDAASRIEQFVAGHGLYVDVLVNSAGMGASGPFIDARPDEIENLMALNVQALTRLTRAVLPDMRLRGRGGILNVGSLGGFAPGPYQAAYYASKAYVLSLTEAVAHEARGQGVRISVAMPGPVDTAFHSRMNAESALYRLLIPAPSAERVARSAYRGYLWGRTVAPTGLVTQVTALAMRFAPHIITVPMIAILLKPRGGSQGVRR